MKDFLDETCKSLNAEFQLNEDHIKDQAKEFEYAIDTTIKIFGDDAFRKWDSKKYVTRFNRAIFDIMVYYFSIPEIRDRSMGNEKEIKQKFQYLCSNDLDFLQSFESSTKDIIRTKKRFSTWGNALSTIIGQPIDSPLK